MTTHLLHTRDDTPMRRRLSIIDRDAPRDRWAEPQGGAMTADLSTELLFSRDQPFDVARRDRDGRLHRIRAGVYIRKDIWARLQPWERYRVRVLAVAGTWSAPVFCLESAAVLQRLPIFGEPTHIHVLSSDGRSWAEGDVIVHGHHDGREVMDAGGQSVTSVADTAVDLARVLPPAFALAVVDTAACSPPAASR
jgi:hypothetical protein